MATQVSLDGIRESKLTAGSGVCINQCERLGDSHGSDAGALSGAKKCSRTKESVALRACEGSETRRTGKSACTSSRSSSTSSMSFNMKCRSRGKGVEDRTNENESRSKVCCCHSLEQQDSKRSCGLGSTDTFSPDSGAKAAGSSVRTKGLGEREGSKKWRLLMYRYESKEEARKVLTTGIAAFGGTGRQQVSRARNGVAPLKLCALKQPVGVFHASGDPSATTKSQQCMVRSFPTCTKAALVGAAIPAPGLVPAGTETSCAAAAVSPRDSVAAVPASDTSTLAAAVHWEIKLAPVNAVEGVEGPLEGGKRGDQHNTGATEQKHAAQQALEERRRSEKKTETNLALSRPNGEGKLFAHAAEKRDVGLAAAEEFDKDGSAELQLRRRKNVSGGRDIFSVTARAGGNSTSGACSVSISRRHVAERSPSACLSTSSTSLRGDGSSGFDSTTSSTTSSSSASSSGSSEFSSSRSGSRSSRSRSGSGDMSESTQSSMRSSASVSPSDFSAGTPPVSSSPISSPAIVSPRYTAPSYVSPFSAAFLGSLSSSTSSSSSSSATPFSFSSPPSSRAPSSRESEGMGTPPRVSPSASPPRRAAFAGGKCGRIPHTVKCSAAANVCAGMSPLSIKDRIRSGKTSPHFMKGASVCDTNRHALEEESTVSKKLMPAFTKPADVPGTGIRALRSRRRASSFSKIRDCAIADAKATREMTFSLVKKNSVVTVSDALSQQPLSTPNSGVTAASKPGEKSKSSPISKRSSSPSCDSAAGVLTNPASEASPSVMHIGGAGGAAVALPVHEKSAQFHGLGHTRRRLLEGRKLMANEGSTGKEERKFAMNAKSNTEKSLSLLGNDTKTVQGCSSFFNKTNRHGRDKVTRATLAAAASETASDVVERQGRRNRVVSVHAEGVAADRRRGDSYEDLQMPDRDNGATASKGRQQKWERRAKGSARGWITSSSSDSVVSTESCSADEREWKQSVGEEEEERHEQQLQQEGSFSALRAAGGLLRRFSFSSPSEDHISTVSPLKRMLKSFLSTSSSSSSSGTDGECVVEPPGQSPCPMATEGVDVVETVSMCERGICKSASHSGEKSSLLHFFLRSGTLGGGRVEGRSEQRSRGGVEADVAVKVYPRLNSLPLEVLQSVLQCLTVEEILRLQAVCRDFYTTIREKGKTFAYIRRLKLDHKWACMDVTERQEMLLQMQRLRHIHVSANAFTGGSITIQEVAALVYRNADTLRYLCLHSPENPLHDETPLHAPFAFRPLPFCRLRVFTLVGCQALEWAHVFSNCCLPSVERFEITYFPVQSDHWSWQVLPDFTALGLSGLHRMLDSMPTLERFTVGLEVRHEEDVPRPGWDFDIVDPDIDFFNDWPDIPERVDGRMLRSEESYQLNERPTSVDESFSSNNARRSHIVAPVTLRGTSGYGSERAGAIGVEAGRYWMAVLEEEEERRRFTGVDPVGGRGRLKSWRGKISEEDFADLCAVAYVRAGAAGNLKRIIIKHRVKTENEDSSLVNVSTLSDIFQGAASFCYRFVSDVFTGFPGTRR